jgi:hypothetical protein
MSSQPDPVLLHDDSMLVAVRRADKSWGLVEVRVGDGTHTGWVVEHQSRQREQAVRVICRGIWLFALQSLLIYLILLAAVTAAVPRATHTI